jgi:serine/threonine protein kinase
VPADPKLQHIAQAICSARGLTLGNDVGSGAFKTTFRVTKQDGSERAFKLYRKAGADARTEREVEAITRCSHAGIASFELIETWKQGADDYVFSLEEFLSGGTLTDRMKAGLMKPDDVRALAKSLIDAVGHIESLGLVHRDIKPDNIMFRTPGGPPVIVDFGLVRDLNKSSLTATWAAGGPGTPLFASPEQLNNEKSMIDWRADQFALGVVLTFAGLGEHPYQMPNLSPHQVVERVAKRQAPSLAAAQWARANGLDPLVKMFAPYPITRYRTPALLAAAWASAGGP